MFKIQPLAFAARNAKVRIARFARAVYNAAHDGNFKPGGLFEQVLIGIDFFFQCVYSARHVHLGAAAGGAGNQVRAVFAQAEGL